MFFFELNQDTFIDCFRNDMSNIKPLINMSELTRQQDKRSELVNISKLCELFNEILDKFAGQQETLDFGCGQWLQLMRGKKVLPSIIHHCFKVTDARGKLLQGPEKLTEVLKVLVRQPLEQQPEDFQRLHHLRWRKIKQPA
jgi:hypothetical protein